MQRRKVEEQARKVEDQERDTAEQLRSLSREEEALQRNLLPKENRLKDMCIDIDVENAQRLNKLRREVWDKILDEVESDNLFPLALSCRYFRQKQKELVEQARQSGPESGKPRLTLKTNLYRKVWNGQPASAEYLRFCSKEKVPKDVRHMRDKTIRRLAALHGYLPLLQELLRPLNMLDREITEHAGGS